MSYTFGFELELAWPVHQVINKLYERGLLPDGELHSYHCDCSHCHDWQNPLRAQRDSTCGGELISGVFTAFTGDFRWLLDCLRDALPLGSVDQNCGLHVHVRVNDQMPSAMRAIRTYASVEEHIVSFLAPGRFRMKRAMNRTLTEGAMFYLQGRRYDEDPPSPLRQAQGVLSSAIQMDRHIDLNFDNERTQTAEYRVWNSTLQPWRIELACRLSVFLAQKALGRSWDMGIALNDAVSARSPLMRSPYSWEEFVAQVADTDSRCAQLMNKQHAYALRTQSEPPPEPTVIPHRVTRYDDPWDLPPRIRWGDSEPDDFSDD